MATEKQLLIPDERILSIIFPDVVGLEPSSCNIISNTFDTCTFIIQAGVILQPVIVRLERETSEASKSRLATIAALHNLARYQLDDIVPSIQQIGIANNSNAERVHYQVTEYLTGTVTLESVWNTMLEFAQLTLMDSILLAVSRLQELGDVKSASEHLMGTPYISHDKETTIAVGSPEVGYFPGIKSLLNGILQKHGESPGYKILENVWGILIQSEYDDIGNITLSHSDLEELQTRVVFCHNDLEPRNILVREIYPGAYRLAGIIDWEMAGFFPFAYEYGFKDVYLGCQNLYFSWYAMFKREASYLLPVNPCHTKFIRAIQIMEESKKRPLTRIVGVRVQAKWIQRERIEESIIIREGWVRKPLEAGERHKIFDKEDMEELENEVLSELGYI
ncbi:hypothetical protein N7456_007446 [Penicillium angulare]|uniref:Aminoglycoside phosphotransferase domain-containing protein n=1 Tax=Penicillium angulare TaxID=116970 RepID=A0A9W9FAK9_9EURO|nr:hypothetical protein N7456_007446 [Penicillium angulare]